jgi:large subunit ribosomal protein L20
MSRVKRGVIHSKKRRNILKKVKGFCWGRNSLIKSAITALKKAGADAYRGRKEKKRDFRSLWQIKINAGVRQHDLSYSKFIGGLKKADIELNRKVLADLAENNPTIFAQVVEAAKQNLK